MTGPPYRYGFDSAEKLMTVHPYLRKLFHYVIDFVDVKILEGQRSQESQDYLFIEGKSKVRWPDSCHNAPAPGRPIAMAVDYAPYPVDWDRLDRFAWVAGMLKLAWEVLKERGEVEGRLRFGIDWDSDGDITDHKFMDYPHVELHLPNEE